MKTAVICYIPVIHSGYISFFKKLKSHKDTHLYVLGEDILSEFPYLERDVRAISPAVARNLAESLGLFREVSVVQDLSKIAVLHDTFVLPDEDISEYVMDKLKDHGALARMVVSNIRLRWDMSAVTKKEKPNDTNGISLLGKDKEFIRIADGVTQKSPDWWRQIGAAAVRDGEVVLKGYNEHIPTEHSLVIEGDPRTPFKPGERFDLSRAKHAEVGIIAEAARRGISLEGCDLYVTTFPCPSCAWSIAGAGFKTVYFRDGYSLLDADMTLKRSGVRLVRVDMKVS